MSGLPRGYFLLFFHVTSLSFFSAEILIRHFSKSRRPLSCFPFVASSNLQLKRRGENKASFSAEVGCFQSLFRRSFVRTFADIVCSFLPVRQWTMDGHPPAKRMGVFIWGWRHCIGCVIFWRRIKWCFMGGRGGGVNLLMLSS